VIDETRYKAWRSGPDPELHVIVYEEAELPLGIPSLGPWLGLKDDVRKCGPITQARTQMTSTDFLSVAVGGLK
jgi:hypothetical protein